MTQLFTNKASGTLASSIASGAASLSVGSGQGALFPAITGSDFFIITVISADGTTREIMKVTARSSDTMSVTRAQEGTSAAAFSAGATVREHLTAGAMTDIMAKVYDPELVALAGLTSAADKGIQFTGSGTAGTYDLTAAGKALLDDANNTAQRTTLGLGTAAVADTGDFAAASHTHAQSDITSLTSDLALKAPLASPALTGNPTTPNQSAGDNSTKIANTAYVDAAVTAGSVAALDDVGDVDASSPSDGDVLTYVSGSGNWEAVAPTGGGGSGTGRWDPMALRAGQSASALDDDWSNTGASLSGIWTGNANWPPTSFDIDTTKPKHLYISANGNSTAIRGILQAIPAGDFVIQTQIFVNPNQTNLSYAGLLLTDGTGGSANCAVLANYQDGNSKFGVQYGLISGLVGNLVTPWVGALNPVVVRLERVSGAYTSEFSVDGIVGQRHSISPGFTATHFGLGGAPFADTLRAGSNAFRYSATPTDRWGAYL